MPEREIAVQFWNRLIDEGVYVNLALPPATPGSLFLIRSSVSSAHTEAQVDRAIAIMTAVGSELGVLDVGRRNRSPNAGAARSAT
jgi:8-amino-7-oxononanoate synthase